MIAKARQIDEMENEKAETDETAAAQENIAPAGEEVSEEIFSVELNQARWSVITFDTCAAKNLTYAEAAQKLRELKNQNTAGLCIVTDEAAERLIN